MSPPSSPAPVGKDGLDKFYTSPATAAICINIVADMYKWDWDLVVEPSAGDGSFYSLFPPPTAGCQLVGIDLAPEHPDISAMDFFDYSPPYVVGSNTIPKNDKTLVIGNPPFGRVSSLAIRFFNHAAEWATVIAFIVPRTFRRVSVQNKLDMCFHLVHDHDIPTSPCCFSPPMMAKCCFQVWERRSAIRERIELPTSHTDWTFLPYGPRDAVGQPTPPDDADFAIRAYGGKCGVVCRTGLDALRPKSWHWIKSNIDVAHIVSRFEQLDYSISTNTARQNSIGRADLVALYATAY